MTESSFTLVVEAYSETHKLILDFLRKMSDEQLHWQLSADNQSIAWHAWHVARWADLIQASFPNMTPELSRRLGEGVQIWNAEGLAMRWGFDSEQLGYAETGTGMPNTTAIRLKFPVKDELLDYVTRVFAAAERAVAALDEQQLNSIEQPQQATEGVLDESTVGDAVMLHITHDNRHLGMMECLLGFQGQPGTANV